MPRHYTENDKQMIEQMIQEGLATTNQEVGEISNQIKTLKETLFYDEISYETYRDSISGTDYRITHIPHKDRSGNLIKLKHGYQNDLMNSGNGEIARDFASRHAATFVANASIWDVSTGMIKGIQIQDGIIKQSTTGTQYTLGIKADNTLVAYPPTTTADAILADGCVDALTAFFPMIENGEAVDPAIYHASGSPDSPYARQAIAQLPNKDILFLTCDGQSKESKGMTFADMIRILLAKGVTFAYNLDGSGSAQTVVNGMLLNRPVDGGGYTERKVADFLYVVKGASDAEKMKAFMAGDGYLKKKIFDLTQDIFNKTDMNAGYIRLKGDAGANYQGIESWEGENKNTKLIINKDEFSFYDYASSTSPFKALIDGTIITKLGTLGGFYSNPPKVTDLNSVTKSCICWALGTAANVPATTSSWGVLHIQVDANNAMQVAFPFHATLNNLMTRRTNTGMSDWYAWRQL